MCSFPATCELLLRSFVFVSRRTDLGDSFIKGKMRSNDCMKVERNVVTRKHVSRLIAHTA